MFGPVILAHYAFLIDRLHSVISLQECSLLSCIFRCIQHGIHIRTQSVILIGIISTALTNNPQTFNCSTLLRFISCSSNSKYVCGLRKTFHCAMMVEKVTYTFSYLEFPTGLQGWRVLCFLPRDKGKECRENKAFLNPLGPEAACLHHFCSPSAYNARATGKRSPGLGDYFPE